MKGKYNCSQAVFIVLVDTVLNSMQEYLLQFTAYRPKYVQAWLDDLRAKLDAAEALPNEEQAQAVSSAIGVILLEQNIICCTHWQTLARYITGAYPANLVKIKLSAAGQSKYESAAEKKWVNTKSMLNSGKAFLAENLATLTANGNMNASFATDFNAAAALFMTKLSDYESSKEAVHVATQNRVSAFNKVFDILMPMMKDGQDIFQNDGAVLTQFTYSHVLERISGHGLAGARGTVINESDYLPIEGALVEIWLAATPGIRYSAVTESDGKYLINSPSGEYKFRVTAEHYVESGIKDISIAVGTISTFNEKLLPLVK